MTEAGFLLRAFVGTAAGATGQGGARALALEAYFGVAATAPIWAYVRVAASESAVVAADAMLRAAEATCLAWSALALMLRSTVWMSGSFLQSDN